MSVGSLEGPVTATSKSPRFRPCFRATSNGTRLVMVAIIMALEVVVAVALADGAEASAIAVAALA